MAKSRHVRRVRWTWRKNAAAAFVDQQGPRGAHAAAMQAPQPGGPGELRIGGKYRLGRKIGRGSFGDIYLGAYSRRVRARSQLTRIG